MTSPVSIRRASEEDASVIARLSSTLGYSSTLEAMQRRLRAILNSKADLLVVATTQEAGVVGWLQGHAATILESGFRVEITGLIVDPQHRRCGAGRALVAEAERWATEISAEAVVVRSNIQRVESHHFYPALGYAVTKTQNVYRKLLNGGGSNGNN
jgi:ribosomal protein S18 acetylase RimI-like enzyme